MINNEYRHLNSQMGQQRNNLEKQMSEHQIMIARFKQNSQNRQILDQDIQISNLNMNSYN